MAVYQLHVTKPAAEFCFPPHDWVTANKGWNSRVSPIRESTALILALEDTSIKVCPLFIFLDSWVVANNGLIAFSGQWSMGSNSYYIQDHALWSLPHWEYTATQTWHIIIKVSNVSIHAKAATEEAHFYAIAD